MVGKGNHPQMAQQFRLVNHYNLPRIISPLPTLHRAMEAVHRTSWRHALGTVWHGTGAMNAQLFWKSLSFDKENQNLTSMRFLDSPRQIWDSPFKKMRDTLGIKKETNIWRYMLTLRCWQVPEPFDWIQVSMVLYALSVRMGFQNWELHPRRFAHTDASRWLKSVGDFFLYVDLYACMSIDVNISLEIDIDIATDFIGMCI